ncbi:MAG: fused MFS/spermidine synthase [Acidobacteriota bacterium]
MLKDRSFVLLLACFLLSGMAGLVYETVWTQQFGLVFGASELAVATVLGAYMAGLAAGAAAARRMLDRVRRPVRVYALLELAIAVSALAVPFALGIAGALQKALLGGLDVPPEAGSLPSALFYLVATFAILFLPTAFMGATLPLLARHAVRTEAEIGPRIGWLYTSNTLGAALGTLAAAFLLLPNLGLGKTVYVAVALNALVFLLAMKLPQPAGSERSAGDGEAPEPDPASPAPGAPEASAQGEAAAGEPGWASWSASGAFILPLVFFSGFVSFTWEVLWSRLLGQLLGGTIYAFGTMLATFLTGIALGSALASRLATSRRRARLGFAASQLGMALLSWGAFLAVDLLPELSRSFGGAGSSLARSVALASLTLLPGALCVGATFPFAVRILTRDADDAGPASARVYATSTVGAIAGAILAGFLLLPALGFAGTASLAIAVSLLLATATALSLRPAPRPVLAAAATCLILGVALRPQTPWRVLGASPIAGQSSVAGDVLYFEVGRSSNVMLREEKGRWRLTTNGLPEAAVQQPGSRIGRFTAARWMPLLPLLHRPDTRSILVVGMGAALTLSDVPEAIEEIHVIELEPEVVEANRRLASVRDPDPLADPRLSIHLNDARSALNLSDRRFDAIVSQPSHPWTSGSSHLFTREFFELARNHLTERGVYVQWMGLQYVDADLLRTLLATLCDVFEHVEVYQPFPNGSLLFAASASPLEAGAGDEARRGYAAGSEQWLRMGLRDAADVLLERRLDDAGSRALAGGAPLNTDYDNLLKIRSPKILGRALGSKGAARLMAPHDALRGARIDLPTFRKLLERRQYLRARELLASLGSDQERLVATALLNLSQGAGRQATLRSLRASVEEEGAAGREAFHALLLASRQRLMNRGVPAPLRPRLEDDPAARAVVEGWRQQRLQNQDRLAELEPELAAIEPGHALFPAATSLRATWRLRTGEADRARAALALLEPAMAFGARSGSLNSWIQLSLQAGEPQSALAALHDLVELAERNPRARELRQQAAGWMRRLPPEHRTPAYENLLERLGGLPQPGASDT